jgi:hypothetical protein
MNELEPASEPLALNALASVVERSRTVLAALRAVHETLAAHPRPDGPDEQELFRLLRERDTLAAELGRAAMRVLAEGGSLADPVAVAAVVTEAAPEPAVVAPEPEPQPEREPLPEPEPDAPAENDDDEGPELPDLATVVAAIGRPTAVMDARTAHAVVRRLVENTEDVDRWLVFQLEVQQALVALTASLARHVQDEGAPLGAEDEWALKAWFSKMTRWSALYRPGYVLGLSRRNNPERDSWLADAQHWWWWLQEAVQPDPERRPAGAREPPPRMWSSSPGRSAPVEEEPTVDRLAELERALADPTSDLHTSLDRVIEAGRPQRDPQLVRMLRPHAERIALVPGFKTLKAALKKRPSLEEADDEEPEAPAIPPDWPYRALVESKVAVLLGGDPRPDAAERIRVAFGMESLIWEENLPRRVEAIAAKVRSHTVDLVLLLRGFLGHSEMNTLIAACKDEDVPFVSVESGYGVSQVKLSIERFLKPLLDEPELRRNNGA